MFVALAVVGSALLLAGAATGKTTRYRGPIRPSGALSFKLTKKHDILRLRNGFSFSRLPLECSGGHETTSGSLTFPVNVHHRRFKAVAKSHSGSASLVMKGAFKHHFRKAAGTIRIRGKNVPLDSGGKGHCDSGVRPFRVRER
jgi:hypothetical protein